MPDMPTNDAPANWGDAFGRMPAEAPPVDGWQRVAARLDADMPALSPVPRAAMPSHQARPAAWFALAATLVLAIALPWQGLQSPAPDESAHPHDGVAQSARDTGDALPTMAELQAESALLETLLAHARDGRVATGSAAAMSAQLEARLAEIDNALANPGLAPAEAHALWSDRVESLQALVSFEGTRRWLAANGEQYDGVLVQVN